MTLKPRRVFIAQALAGAAALCGAAARAQVVPRKLQVVASFSILADIVREVAADAAEVYSLVGANADAHVYEPRPADVQRVARADLVFINGLGFEGWIERLIRASGYRGTVVVASQGVAPRRLGRGFDPHAWQSLKMAQQYVETIRAALSVAAPAQAASFAQRAAVYRARLAALDAESKASFDAVPPDQRRIISSHDAFGYLGDAYGLRFISPRGWNSDADASAADLAAIVRQVRQQKARALFVENISDRRLVERIAQETGARIGGTLYSDALSAPGTVADTYLRLYAHNVQVLVEALRAAR